MIDTHCHLDDTAYSIDRDDTIVRQRQNGVEAIIIPGVDEKSCEAITDLCSRFPSFLYSALGLHPENIERDGKQQLDIIEKQIGSKRDLVAIGEIGLDYHYTKENKDIQQDVYRIQLQWAYERHLPIIVHCREAVEDVLKITRAVYEQSHGALTGVIHCFNGSVEVAKQWLDMHFYIGVGGIVTFKNCKLSETLVHIPIERIVLETDGPYMAPVPWRGQRNESVFIKHVINKLQTVYQMSFDEIEKITSRNAQQLFCLYQSLSTK